MNKVLATALLAACCTVVHAQPSAAKKELVAKVLQLQRPGIELQARALTERPATMMMQSAAAVIQQRVPLEKREALIKEIQADLVKHVEEVAPTMSALAWKLMPSTTGVVLENKFSEAELKQLVAALDSPVYRKYQQSSEEMFRPLTDKLIQESRPDVEARFKVLDQSIRKRLEAAVGQPAAPAVPATKP